MKNCIEKIMKKIFKVEDKPHFIQTEDKPEHQHEQDFKEEIAKNEAINKIHLNDRRL